MDTIGLGHESQLVDVGFQPGGQPTSPPEIPVLHLNVST